MTVDDLRMELQYLPAESEITLRVTLHSKDMTQNYLISNLEIECVECDECDAAKTGNPAYISSSYLDIHGEILQSKK